MKGSTMIRHRITLVPLAAILLVSAAARFAVAVEPDKRPNIIFFLTDDQRNDTLGCTGHPIVKTPTIDRLAAEGVLFENSFCQVPICAANRATLFTGLSLRTHGHNFGEPPVAKTYAATSYPALLKAAGYRTGFAGKYGMRFDKVGAKDIFDFYTPINRNPYLKKMPDGSKRHETDLCGDAAVEFIKSTPADTPFCLSISFNASHAEDGDRRPGFHFQWPESTDGMYEDVEMPAPRLGNERYRKAMPPFLQEDGLSRGRFFWRWDTPEKYETNMRAYFRMLSGIDNVIARVQELLKEKGLDQNTIIIYTGDNGYMMGDRGIAGKWNHYEQSVRVPLVVYDPRLAKNKRGRVLKELASSMDIAPTIVDYAGLKVPSVVQGLSLVPLIQADQHVEWREDIFCEHYFNRYPDWHSVRNDRHKYAVYYDNGPYECLYDLQEDPDEFTNLAADPQQAATLAKMRKRLEWYREAYPAAKQEKK